MVHRAIRGQFSTAYDFASTYKCDYHNVCKWFNDYSKLPIKVAFEMSDKLGLSVVVFRSY